MCVHNGNDGNCGTTPSRRGLVRLARRRSTSAAAYKGPYAIVATATGVLDGHVYSRRKAPRLLRGTAVAHTRDRLGQPAACAAPVAGAASPTTASRERFARTRCGGGELLQGLHARRASPTCCRRRWRAGATCSTSRRPTRPATARASRAAAPDRLLCPLSARAAPAELDESARARGAATAALALALAAVGCGLGAGKAPSAVGLRRDARLRRDASCARWGAPQARGQETVMSLLTRNATVATRYGGGFVQSIDGLAGGHSGGRPGRLVLLRQRHRGVQGRGVDERARRAITSGGTGTTGARPTTFPRSSARSRSRFSTASTASACRCAWNARAWAATPAARSPRGCARRTCRRPSRRSAAGAGAAQTLRVAVGTLARDRRRLGRARTERRPARERRLRALLAVGHDAHAARRSAHAAQTLAAGAGLIAATRSGEDAPVWAVTGTDAAGVDARRRRVRQATLAHRFAVAVGAGGPLALPRPGA